MTTIKNVLGIRVVLCYLSLISLLPACTSGVSEDVPDNTSETVVSIPTDTPKSVSNDVYYVGDGGFLSGEPCGPPCFWGIVPGITTGTEAIEIMKAKGVWDKCEISEKDYDDYSRRYVNCHVSGMNVHVLIQIDTDVIERVHFSPSYGMTLGEIITRHGKPDAIAVTPFNTTPEYPSTFMILFYDDIKTEVVLPPQDDVVFRAEASTEIDGIFYYGEDFYESVKFPPISNWQGYGEYEPKSLLY